MKLQNWMPLISKLNNRGFRSTWTKVMFGAHCVSASCQQITRILMDH